MVRYREGPCVVSENQYGGNLKNQKWKRIKNSANSYLVFPQVKRLAKSNSAKAICNPHHTKHHPRLPACQARQVPIGHHILVFNVGTVVVHQLCVERAIMDAAVVGKSANNAQVNIDWKS